MSSTYLRPIISSGDSTPGSSDSENSQEDDNSQKQLVSSELSKATATKQHSNSNKKSNERRQSAASTIDEDEDDDDEFELDHNKQHTLRQFGGFSNATAGYRQQRQENTDCTANKRQEATIVGVDELLDDEVGGDDDDDDDENNNVKQKFGFGGGHLGQNLSSRFAGIASQSSKSASQLHNLFKSATNNQSQRAKKLKQLMQSLPLTPLVATSIMTVLIVLCLILLNAPPLQLAAAASRLPAQVDGGSGSEGPEASALLAAAAGEEPLQKFEQLDGEVERRRPKLALKRELIEELLNNQQPQHQIKRLSATGEQQDDSGSLGTLLFGGAELPQAVKTGDALAEETYLDSEPVQAQEARPAHLRAPPPPIELDLSEPPELLHAQHRQRPPQQPQHSNQQKGSWHQQQHHSKHQIGAYKLQQQQQHRHEAAGQQPPQQQPQQAAGNNHERRFDVAQIRKYNN